MDGLVDNPAPLGLHAGSFTSQLCDLGEIPADPGASVYSTINLGLRIVPTSYVISLRLYPGPATYRCSVICQQLLKELGKGFRGYKDEYGPSSQLSS